MCVCVCVCAVLCNLASCKDSCNHHDNQGTELFHHYKGSISNSLGTTPMWHFFLLYLLMYLTSTSNIYIQKNWLFFHGDPEWRFYSIRLLWKIISSGNPYLFFLLATDSTAIYPQKGRHLILYSKLFLFAIRKIKMLPFSTSNYWLNFCHKIFLQANTKTSFVFGNSL